ncbi:MAG: L,D-transpeptidase [Hyphomicrobiales bacterium]|nr:L,D-transpeptidase [Hyphomicrobiales bacterium]
MRRFIVAALSAALSLAFASAATRAQAEIRVEVSRVSQTMDVIVDGEHAYTWRVSTGRSGWATPPGTFHPQFMAARWFSRVFNNAPMPHSIFYSGPFAIHGTVDVARLGRPASHGCIRLAPANAAVLFELVQKQGMRNTTIVVQ